LRFSFITLVLMVGPIGPVWGQSAVWQPQGATSGSIYYNGGNVGIGTSTPGARLEIQQSSAGDIEQFRLKNPSDSPYASQSIRFVFGSGANEGASITQGWESYPYLAFSTFGSEVMRLKGGNVGIGTASPQYKLAVNGVIGAKDVIVTNAGWPDYVFKPEYKLRPLKDVEEFIREKGHLPEIPSEAEVTASGVSVGQMQAKLLEKIEELTLHLIRQEKENQEMRERLRKLEIRLGER
jgi:hypothetical protein